MVTPLCAFFSRRYQQPGEIDGILVLLLLRLLLFAATRFQRRSVMSIVGITATVPLL
jgi:hypothetical protein